MTTFALGIRFVFILVRCACHKHWAALLVILSTLSLLSLLSLFSLPLLARRSSRVTPHQRRTAPIPSAAFAVPSAARAAATQTPAMAVVFMCNLTLGTGPLTLPYAFEAAGIGLGTIFLLFIGFVASCRPRSSWRPCRAATP